MRNFVILLFASLVFIINGYSQKFNSSINKDSLLQVALKGLPEAKKSEFLKMYNEGNEQSKEFLLFMLSLPRSSKRELISNIDSNFEKIILLKTSYLKLIPKDYIVSIEFNPAQKIISTEESIDLKIQHISNTQRDFKQEWKCGDSINLLNLLHSQFT